LPLSPSLTASGRVFSSRFAIISLYIRTEIPQSNQTSQMPRHPNSSSIRPTLLVLLALLAQDASAIQWSSPRTGDIISPGDMVLAAWYASPLLMTATVVNSAPIGKQRRVSTRLSFDCAPKVLVIEKQIAVCWGVLSLATGRTATLRPCCAFAC